MKITKLLLICITVILFSCSEDEELIPTSEGMIGSWNLTGLEYKGTTTTTISGITSKASFTGTTKEMDFTTTFSVDPNTVISEGSYIIVLKTTVAGQTTTEELPVDEIYSDGTWSLNGKTLTITPDDGEPQEATVVAQTDTKLSLKIEADQTQGTSDFSTTTKVKAVYTFQKN